MSSIARIPSIPAVPLRFHDKLAEKATTTTTTAPANPLGAVRQQLQRARPELLAN
jgi:hypothetical protein